ncbi:MULTISPECIES: response regulator [unclassified Janthinobacterium]|uniref:response regulator n=1 Tax=unclassified Janthinobacterium TaxID=2610881 RepID=UPI0017C56464|nr:MULTISPECIES: response regulator [unclassified Janthinobacterium]MBB5367904.1 twitching motility two-component system response regulator PilG [Janthinobacterium sp. K2C7]MBB5379618.1 twitching motility two-component system response regulator PilG [Janthinobacterium sp. K2Li3]MBB5386286.1 twitching motility two-component system response regulator PilG [Janthinobacterium sp. K2E3]
MTSPPLSDTASAGPTILVIDDSATIRSSVERILSGAGYRVVVAEDGFDALAKIGDCQPALIVCDILMPRLDGYRTCALIKASAAFHATPVLMLSAKAGLFDRARGALAGASDCLAKPLVREDLLAAVGQHLAAPGRQRVDGPYF